MTLGTGRGTREGILARIHLIRLPLYPQRKDRRFSMNVYLIEDEQLTLVDTGPDQDEAFEVLDRGVKNLGYTLQDVRRVLLTHAHINHFGLARRIKDLSDAQVCAYRGDMELYKTHPAPLKRGLVRLARLMRQCRFPSEPRKRILRGLARKARQASPFVVDIGFDDGDMIEFEDFSLEVVRTPGHTPGHSCFFSYEADVMFSGDHLQGAARPVAAVMFDPDGHRYRSFPQYWRSLKKVYYLSPSLILPGHGKVVEKSKERVETVLSELERESNAIAARLTHMAVSPHEVHAGLNGLSHGPLDFSTFSWLVGHLDLLKERGVAVESYFKGHLQYRRRSELTDLPIYVRRAGHA
ncbi:MAG: MBL fold metallo-hydrolase [Nitrospirae bacterium]|nr:MBL fold metallo-hydrolase [Nitrospirota bacterium]